MNKTTQKILILAISAIVVIVAVTTAVLVINKNKQEELRNENNITFNENVKETEETPSYIVPTPQPSVSEVMSTVADITNQAANNQKPNKKPNSNNNSNSSGNNNSGSANNNGNTNNNTGSGTTSTTSPDTGKFVQDLIDDEQFLGYRYNKAGGYYYTDDKDCWQVHSGYNEVYDTMAPVTAMFIDQVRIRFTYGGKDWMIQFWKGQYGWLLVGAEIGVYTNEEGSYTGEVGSPNHYYCAAEEDWLYMDLKCYFAENNSGHYKLVFAREYDKYWWATGFVQGQLTKYTAPRTELKVRTRITLKSEEMAKLFAQELKNSGFVTVGGSDKLIDDSYYRNGADVYVLWSTIQHDCFVGYEG